jgi:chromosome partitioning protein
MAEIVVVAALKGGVGKSTLVANLATALHRTGHKILVVDADSQATLRTWARQGIEAGHDGPAVVAIEALSLRRDLAALASGFDLVIVDLPPRLGADSRAAILLADLVLLPVVPGAADAWALQETLTVLADAQALRPEIRAAIVLNRADRTELARMTSRAVAGFSDVPVLAERLGARVAIGEATLAGRGVVDYAPSSTAAYEVRSLTRAVLALLGRKSDVEEVRCTREGISAARPSTHGSRRDGGTKVSSGGQDRPRRKQAQER